MTNKSTFYILQSLGPTRLALECFNGSFILEKKKTEKVIYCHCYQHNYNYDVLSMNTQCCSKDHLENGFKKRLKIDSIDYFLPQGFWNFPSILNNFLRVFHLYIFLHICKEYNKSLLGVNTTCA